MSRQLPIRAPLEGLWHACLLILGSVIALTVAVHLLERIWPWLLGTAAVIAVVVIARLVWQHGPGRW